MSRHRMSPGDAAWLHMDRPLNRMIVNSVMWFDEPLDWDAVTTLIEQRLIERLPRFSQRVVEVPSVVWWEDVTPFDIRPHLKHATLPAPGGHRELEHYVSGLLHAPLALNRPLWELHFIDGYRGRGSAIVVRIHHCVADGIALSRVMMSLTDDPADAARADMAAPRPRRSAMAVLETVNHLGESLAHDLVHPSRLKHLVEEGVADIRATTHVLGLPADAHTSLRGHLSLSKTALWSDPIPLSLVRETAHRAGVTVNDLVLSAIGGALRSYLIREDGAARDVRAILPVNLRPPNQPLPAELGNRFGMVFLTLPLSIEDPQARLAETKRRSDKIKNSPQSVVTFAVLDLMGRTPYGVEQVLVDVFSAKASMVITNVPGPNRPVFLAGRRLRGTIAWPPESGSVGLGLSIISYDGELTIGALCDDTLIPAPRRLLAEIVAELHAMISQRGSATPGQLGEPA